MIPRPKTKNAAKPMTTADMERAMTPKDKCLFDSLSHLNPCFGAARALPLARKARQLWVPACTFRKLGDFDRRGFVTYSALRHGRQLGGSL